MPLQNRVTPFGAIIAVADRGLFTGNRGILHDPVSRTIRRAWVSKSWLVCRCDYKGRKRPLMSPGSWTELFFLDEATALGAGHRPCFACRRARAKAFQAAWACGNGCAPQAAKAMDAVLHAERLAGRAKRLHPLDQPLSGLPDGTMVSGTMVSGTMVSGTMVSGTMVSGTMPGGVAVSGAQDSFVVVAGGVRRWTPSGYVPGSATRASMALLTPPSTLRALRAGYRPDLHPSAFAN